MRIPNRCMVFENLTCGLNDMVTKEPFYCVADYEVAARKSVDKALFAYLRGAANDGITYQENERAYKRYQFRPKVLKDVSQSTTGTSVLGQDIGLPIGLSPFGLAKLFDSTGEVGLAQACKDMDTCFIQNNASYHSIEEVIDSVPEGLKWFQIYLYKDRKIGANVIQRAERLGYKAIVYTVDSVIEGRRLDYLRHNITFPMQSRRGNYEYKEGSKTVSYIGQKDETMTWKDLKWLKQQTKLPVVVKGIMTDFDARQAIEHGADAIIVSNHGGRQLDGVLATIDALQEVIKVVNGKCEVYLDGGIRSGTDVLKALALGARAVFIGRPAAWAFAVNGTDGVKHVLKLLKEELEIAMKLCGKYLKIC